MQLKQARGKTLRACSLHTALKYTKQFRNLCKRQLTNIKYLSLQRLQLPPAPDKKAPDSDCHRIRS